MPAKKIDLRRESGQRTRDQLLTAALSLLAERGPDGVTLREITDAAGVNVAAVSYHFGSLKGLCEAAGEGPRHAQRAWRDVVELLAECLPVSE